MQWSIPLVLTILWLPLLSVGTAGETSRDQRTAQELPAPHTQWLEEVRAQRRAWEAERAEARKAREARRRWIDPWGAEQQEAREKQAEQRREAAKNFVERQRETMRNPSIGRYPYDGPPALEPSTHWPRPADSAIEPPPIQTERPPRASYPPGWNNPWFYRGY